ncbi:hypothetical protein [Pseudomonas lundensis]|uniref:hypothetical protein n=1 Tax=Pseudomonas lundensis TaxID=86185 RepID=UPI000EFF2B39|nr:hypothetical protein [Pseudomonas lundensis]NNA04657.1 hypothetical protein [Pseudomonas lundensis]RMP61100.1 hypothetical protein ALQ18_01030 [Pseudomonas marginalis pv. marginalis]
MEPPTDRKRMDVTACNPFIPAGDYRRGLELTLQTIAPYLTQRELVALVHKKLRMEDPEPAEDQYLQAAVELTVCAHYARYFTSSFVYEDKVMPPRDVDCSFCSGGYKFNVEVKCADYTAKHKVDSVSEFIIRAIGRQSDYRDTVAKLQKSFASVGSTLVPGLHMDNKLKDYLYDAHGKFPDVADDRQYNVLVVGCDDPGDMQLWEGYLTGERGLFTGDSFADPARYSSVDLVVLTNLYHRHRSVPEKDMLRGHWTFTNAFSILYANPRSRKPRAMFETFARTLRTYNNELSTHKIEGDAPEYVMQRLVISHYVSQVQWPSGQYCFQPKPGKSTQTEAC